MLKEYNENEYYNDNSINDLENNANIDKEYIYDEKLVNEKNLISKVKDKKKKILKLITIIIY